MATEHKMTWDPDFTESVDENGWVVRELTGITPVNCSCGFAKVVANRDVRRVVEEHEAGADTADTA